MTAFASELTSRDRTRVLAVLFAGVLMGALDIAIVGPALPALRAHFGAESRMLAWTVSIYVLFGLIGAPLMAKLSEARGRRTVYVADVLLFAAGSLVVAAAPTFGVLLAGRALQGLAAGGIFPVASAVIGDTFPVASRGRALGLIGAVFGLAFLIGPVLGGLLLQLGWRWLFLANLPVAAAVAVAAWRVLPEARPDARRVFDVAGLTVLGAALAAIALGLNRLDPGLGWRGLAPGGVTVLVGILLLPLFAFVERRAVDPLLRPDLLAARQVRLALGLGLGAGVAESAVAFVPDLLVAVFGVAPDRAAFMLAPVVLAMAVGAPLAGRALDQVGSRAVVLTGAVLLALGMAGVVFVGASVLRFYLAAFLVGIGLSSLLGAPLRYIMLAEAGPTDRAPLQAALSLFTNVGLLLGSALLGALIASAAGVRGYEVAFGFVGVVSIVMLVVASGLKGRAAEAAALREAPSSAGRA